MSLETETITITGLQPGTTTAIEELAQQEGKGTDDLQVLAGSGAFVTQNVPRNPRSRPRQLQSQRDDR